MQHISMNLHRLFQRRSRDFGYPVVLTAFFILAALPAQAEVTSPFPSFSFAQGKAEQTGVKFECGDEPAPVRDLSFESIYEDGDDTHSKLDAEKLRQYKDTSSDLYGFESKVVKMANLYVVEREKNTKAAPKIAACVQNWLDKWAKHDALLGDVNRSGILVRKWSLASLASAYAEIKNEPHLKPERKERIERWLSKVATTVMQDFSTNEDKNSRLNNHLYWAAWAVGVTGYAVDDRQMFSWAMDKARVGLNQVQADGSLPLEMARGKRALLYHVFALSPLVMLAELGRQNDVDLYSVNDGAIHRLVTLSMKGIQNQSYFESKTGEDQDMSFKNSNGLAWLVPYHRRFGNRAADDVLSKMSGSMTNRRLGGDLRILYKDEGARP